MRVINIPMSVVIGQIEPMAKVSLSQIQLNQLAYAAHHIAQANDAQTVAFYPYKPGGNGEVVAFRRPNNRVSLLGKEYQF